MSFLRAETGRSPSLDRSARTRAARPVAVFDLDGTLVDTAPDLTASLNHCLRFAGLPDASIECVRPDAGKGVRIMLEGAYARAGVPLAPQEFDEQFARFLRYYEANIADHSGLFAGAEAAMDRLAAAGFILAICTNKLEHLAVRLLDALGQITRFAAICGPDTFQRRKPDPLHLLGTIERAGGSVAGSLMIGDSRADIDAAFAAGIPSILVDFGYGADEETRAQATRTVSTFAEIDAQLLADLVSARVLAG